MTSTPPAKGMTIPTKIMIGLVLGAAAGIVLNQSRDALDAWLSGILQRDVEIVEPFLRNGIEPVGQIFMRLLFMTVVPLVFASLALGVSQLGGMKHVGQIGLRTLAYFVLTSGIAVVIGLLLVNTIRPGDGFDAKQRDQLIREEAGKLQERKPVSFGVNTFVEMVPRNPIAAMANMEMLGVIVFALLIGVGITHLSDEKKEAMQRLLDAVGDLMVFIIHLAMKLAPYGVFCLILATTTRLGLEVLEKLAWYVGTVLFGLALDMFLVFPLLLIFFGRVNPWWFFVKVRPVIVTAFSTSSSSATLPTSITAAEERLGVPSPIAGFVLPLGATMNMNGTALFEGVTVLFLAQVFGIELTLGQQLIVVVMSVITAIGAAGVPGGSIPLLMMVLAAVHVPPQAIALILGVDRLLDMCRTTLNVTGDLTAAVYIARVESASLAGESRSGSSGSSGS